MKKIFLSLAIIITVSSFSFLLTKAYFSDKKTSNGNKFTVGTLNLQVGGSDNNKIEPFVISGLGEGEIKGEKIWKLKNIGSLAGQLSVSMDNLVNSENGCNTPEKEVDTTCDNPGIKEGELGDIVNLTFYIDGSPKITIPLNLNGVITLTNYWQNSSNLLVLQPNQEIEIKVNWFTPNSYGNEIQSDSLNFDLGFNLQQVIE